MRRRNAAPDPEGRHGKIYTVGAGRVFWWTVRMLLQAFHLRFRIPVGVEAWRRLPGVSPAAVTGGAGAVVNSWSRGWEAAGAEGSAQGSAGFGVSFSSSDQSFPPNDQPFPPNDQSFSASDQSFPPDDQSFPPDDQSFSPNDQSFSPNDQSFPPTDQSFAQPDQSFAPSDESLRPVSCRWWSAFQSQP